MLNVLMKSSEVRLGFWLGLILLVHLIFAAMTPLTEDEAYYRLWSETLQFGYYDHPPMISWWIAMGRSLIPDGELAIRLVPALASALTSVVVFRIAKHLKFADRTAIRAAIWFQATFIVALGGFLATPDGPATLFWSLTLLFVIKASPEQSGFNWAMAGLFAGLATLSKYSALFLGPGLLLWLIATEQGRRNLIKPGPWIALAIAGCVFGTNVYWNAQNEWLTFVKQFGRVAPHSVYDPRDTVEFVAGQLVLLNPIIVGFLISGLMAYVRADRRFGVKNEVSTDMRALLWMSSVPFATYLLMHSIHSTVQAHWPTPLYASAALLAAHRAEKLISSPLATGFRRAAVPFAIGIVGVCLLIFAVGPIGGKKDITKPVRGWGQFAVEASQYADDLNAEWVGVMSYSVKSMLEAQKGWGRPTVQLFQRERYLPKDSFWNADTTAPGVLIDLERRIVVSDLDYCFNRIEFIGRFDRRYKGASMATYAVYRVSQPKRDIVNEGCWDVEPPSRAANRR